jgi:hypothetical protein
VVKGCGQSAKMKAQPPFSSDGEILNFKIYTMENSMKYVFIQIQGDRERILERVAHYRTFTRQQLVNRYNEACTTGIVGVRAQAVDLLALRFIFREVFNASPISVENNMIIALTGRIALLDDTFIYLDQHLN